MSPGRSGWTAWQTWSPAPRARQSPAHRDLNACGLREPSSSDSESEVPSTVQLDSELHWWLGSTCQWCQPPMRAAAVEGPPAVERPDRRQTPGRRRRSRAAAAPGLLECTALPQTGGQNSPPGRSGRSVNPSFTVTASHWQVQWDRVNAAAAASRRPTSRRAPAAAQVGVRGVRIILSMQMATATPVTVCRCKNGSGKPPTSTSRSQAPAFPCASLSDKRV